MLLIVGAVVFVSAAAVVAAIALPGAAEPFGGLRDAEWLVLGTFADQPAAGPWSERPGLTFDYLAAAGGEANVSLRPGQSVAGVKVRACRAKNGVVDLLGLFPGRMNAVAYAFLTLRSPAAQDLALKVGSDDGIRVWCNGRLLWSDQAVRPLVPDQEAFLLPLKAGENRLMVKVDQVGGLWEFSARTRTLSLEEKGWAAAAPSRLTVFIPGRVLKTAAPTWCAVNTAPAFVIDRPTEVTVKDEAGRTLAAARGRIGEMIPFTLPGDYTGVVSLQAECRGKHGELRSAPLWAVAGDAVALSRSTAALARRLAAAAHGPNDAEDASATLEFLADQLEGKTNASLSTPERNIVALRTINDVSARWEKGAWRPAALRGLRQWAYRSSLDDTLQPYSVVLPENYDPSRRYNLLVDLHGYGEDDYTAARTLAPFCPDDFIVLAPFGRGDMYYRSKGEVDVLDVIALAEKIYSVDPNRIYIMGNSMGGLGAWRFGQLYPDRFAALASFCGWTGDYYLENLRHVPVLVAHGDADTNVPISFDRKAALRLKELGFTVRFDELPGVGHDAWHGWAARFGGGAVFDFFRQYVRDPWPARVSLNTKLNLRYGKLSWVRVEELSGVEGRIDAEITGPRGITATTQGIKTFSLDMRHPLLAGTGNVTITIDGAALAVPAGKATRVFDFSNGRWSYAAPGDRRGLVPHYGGGWTDGFFGPLAVIYGTRDKKRLTALKTAAARFADLSPNSRFPFGDKTGRIPVWADKDAPASVLRDCNIILLGNAAENSVTAECLRRWGGTVPVRWEGSTVLVQGHPFQYCGVVMTAPNPFNKSRLATVGAIPFNAKELEDYAGYANISLRAVLIDETAVDGLSSPDIFILSAPDKPAVALWSFNRDWRKLKAISFPASQ